MNHIIYVASKSKIDKLVSSSKVVDTFFDYFKVLTNVPLAFERSSFLIRKFHTGSNFFHAPA